MALAAVAALVLSAAPVSAQPIEGGHYAWTDSGTECDDAYDRESSGHGVFLTKDATPATGGQFFYYQDKYWYQDVFTNPGTGKWAVLRGTGIYKESRYVAQGNGIFAGHNIEAGQPFVIEDMYGRVVVRDRGLIDVYWVVDTHNDSAPGADPIAEPIVVRVSGPHAGFSDTFDFCAVLDSLIGAP
jgi:hypothetical protein